MEASETTPDPELLLTTAAAADRIGIKPAKLTAMIRNDEIAAISTGGDYRIPERVVTEYIEARSTLPTPGVSIGRTPRRTASWVRLGTSGPLCATRCLGRPRRSSTKQDLP